MRARPWAGAGEGTGGDLCARDSGSGCGSLLSNESQAGALVVSVWEVYSDTAVLDWYITLQHKFR